MTTKSFVVQGSQLYFANEASSPALAVAIAQMTGFTGLGGKKTKIDQTNFDSGAYKEYVGGLIDVGEISFDLIWDFTSTNHQLVKTLVETANSNRPFFFGASDGIGLPPTISGTLVGGNTALVPPVTASPKLYTRSGFLFAGYFAMFQADAPLDGLIKVKAAVQLSGTITNVAKGASAA